MFVNYWYIYIYVCECIWNICFTLLSILIYFVWCLGELQIFFIEKMLLGKYGFCKNWETFQQRDCEILKIKFSIDKSSFINQVLIEIFNIILLNFVSQELTKATTLPQWKMTQTPPSAFWEDFFYLSFKLIFCTNSFISCSNHSLVFIYCKSQCMSTFFYLNICIVFIISIIK